MNIKFESNGLKVNIPVPEPVEQDGEWWEAVAYRPALKGEPTLDDPIIEDALVRKVVRNTEKPYWIMRPISKPPADWLDGSIYEIDGDRPRPLTVESRMYYEAGTVHVGKPSGKWRWHLRVKRVEPPKNPLVRSCATCAARSASPGAWPCVDCVTSRSNWHAPGTPPPQPPAAEPRFTEAKVWAWPSEIISAMKSMDYTSDKLFKLIREALERGLVEEARSHLNFVDLLVNPKNGAGKDEHQ